MTAKEIHITDGTKHIIHLPDLGEDASDVELRLPNGDKVELCYDAFHGNLDVCIYEVAEGERGKMFRGWASKECHVTNWTDKKDERGVYVESMCDAPQAEGCGAHERVATQLIIHVTESQDQ